jgi:hypothetical protein
MKTFAECESDKVYCVIQQSTIRTINDYVTDGLKPGSFTRAVLANDLMEAVGRADMVNLKRIPAICTYIYCEVPSVCRGSYAAVEIWIRNGGLNGQIKENTHENVQ